MIHNTPDINNSAKNTANIILQLFKNTEANPIYC
jgi:hypothetical protein